MSSTEVDMGLSEVGDGRLVKMEIDYKEQVDAAIPEAESLAKDKKLSAALDLLYGLEKETRVGCDMRSNGRVLETMVRLCFEAKEWNTLNETIIQLSKKRSLIKQAVAKMVRECCTYVEKTPDEATLLKLIDTLRTVTAGKIYVEVERARLTYQLVEMKEREDKVEEAATLLLELQVETYGTMEMDEKVKLLLEQMRLCLAKKDFMRAQIISNKISKKFFEKTSIEVQQKKLKFYQQMIELDQHGNKYLDICRHFRAIYDTPMVQNDPMKLEEALKNVVLYVLLATYDNEQWDLLHRIKGDRNLEKVPQYKKLLDLFTTEELMSWKGDIIGGYEEILIEGTSSSPATQVFTKDEAGTKRWTDLQTRVGEHNIRMIAKYYTQISVERMSDLLDWSKEKTEEFLCHLVVTGVIAGAKIDRPAGIVRFQPPDAPTDVLDQWGTSLRQLMDNLNKTSHLILKEEMVHRHLHAHRPIVNGNAEK